MEGNLEAKLQVNNVAIELNPFAEAFLARTVAGAVSSLKGAEDVQNLELHLDQGPQSNDGNAGGKFAAVVDGRGGVLMFGPDSFARPDQVDAVPVDRGEVVGPRPPRQDSTVDGRVQGLHAAVEHLREAGHVRHVQHAEPVLRKGPRRAPGRDELNTARRELPGERGQSGLVRHAQQCSSHSHSIRYRRRSSA